MPPNLSILSHFMASGLSVIWADASDAAGLPGGIFLSAYFPSSSFAFSQDWN